MRDRSIVSPDRNVSSFINFVKASSIIGIFCYHFFCDTYLQNIYDLSSSKLMGIGAIQYFWSASKDVSGKILAVPKISFFFGQLGVELFVISSGFGLSFSHIYGRKKGWGRFYLRRFFRIVPLYYLFLFASFVAYSFFVYPKGIFSSKEGLEALVEHVLFVQTFFADSLLFYGLYYFVAVIVQLYLLFPLLLKTMTTNANKIAVFIALCLIAVFLPDILRALGIVFTGVLVTYYLPYFYFGMLFADFRDSKDTLYALFFNPLSAWISLALLTLLACLTSLYQFEGALRMMMAFAIFFSMPIIYDLINKGGMMKKLMDRISFAAYVIFLMHTLFLRLILTVFARELLSAEPVWLVWLLFGVFCFIAIFYLAYSIQKKYDVLLKKVPEIYLS